MKVLSIIFCMVALNICAQENDIKAHENDFNKIATVQNVPTSEIKDLCAEELVKQEEVTETNFVASKALSSEPTDVKVKSLYCDAYLITILKSHGYLYHIGDYYDSTRIVTCLNGPLKGLQSVYFCGAKIDESFSVLWLNNYFVHYYPGGEVHSYPNAQTIELY